MGRWTQASTSQHAVNTMRAAQQISASDCSNQIRFAWITTTRTLLNDSLDGNIKRRLQTWNFFKNLKVRVTGPDTNACKHFAKKSPLIFFFTHNE